MDTTMRKTELLDLVEDYESLIDALEAAAESGDLRSVKRLLADWREAEAEGDVDGDDEDED